MGYYSKTTKASLVHDEILFSKELKNRLVEFFKNDYDNDGTVSYFFEFSVRDVDSEKLKISVFPTFEELKAYILDKEVAVFLNKLYCMTGAKFTLTYVLEGEESGDISKYVISSDGSATRFKSIISFEETGTSYRP